MNVLTLIKVITLSVLLSWSTTSLAVAVEPEEILSNPKGGYRWIFDLGDLEGKGHWDPELRKSRLNSI